MRRKVTILRVPGSHGKALCGGGRLPTGSGGGETGLGAEEEAGAPRDPPRQEVRGLALAGALGPSLKIAWLRGRERSN